MLNAFFTSCNVSFFLNQKNWAVWKYENCAFKFKIMWCVILWLPFDFMLLCFVYFWLSDDVQSLLCNTATNWRSIVTHVYCLIYIIYRYFSRHFITDRANLYKGIMGEYSPCVRALSCWGSGMVGAGYSSSWRLLGEHISVEVKCTKCWNPPHILTLQVLHMYLVFPFEFWYAFV